MRRRRFLAAATTVVTAALAGCGGSGGSGGRVDGATDGNETYTLAFEAGDEVTVAVEVPTGPFAIVEFVSETGHESADETLFTETIESSLSRTVTVETAGKYTLVVATAEGAEASVLVEVA